MSLTINYIIAKLTNRLNAPDLRLSNNVSLDSEDDYHSC